MRSLNYIVLMGEYIVVDRKQDSVIESPGAQTCVILVLKSKDKIAVAHIDSPVGIVENIDKILKRFGNQSIKATLVGGVAGLPIVNTRVIYQQIYNVLNQRNIQYKHQYYSINVLPILLPIGYAVLRLASLVGPESYLASFIFLVITYFAQTIVSSSLEKSFDVEVNEKEGDIKILTNDLKNSIRMMSQVKLAHRDRFKLFAERFAMNPVNATPEQMALAEITTEHVANYQ